MVALDLSPGSLEADGFGSYLGESGNVTAEAGDVGDCFYNFTIPELAAWFATDDTFTKKAGPPWHPRGAKRRLRFRTPSSWASQRGRCTVRAKTERAWMLWAATRGLLRRRRVSGRVLQVWLGLANFHFQLSRPALSVLSATYKFAAEHRDHRAPSWPSVRSELRDALGLIFVVEFDMSAPLCPEVHIGDSSDRGYALRVTQASS